MSSIAQNMITNYDRFLSLNSNKPLIIESIFLPNSSLPPPHAPPNPRVFFLDWPNIPINLLTTNKSNSLAQLNCI